MIRRGRSLHTLYPSRLEDHLSAEFGDTNLDVCFQACAIPRWFNFPMLKYALSDKLSDKVLSSCFDRIRSEEFVKPYGDVGYFFSDPERYFFLDFAFVHDPALGGSVLASLCEYFRGLSEELPKRYKELASRGYYDSLGTFDIEYLHLLAYDSRLEVRSVLLLAFQRFCQWRSDPSFNHGLNRRLVKALRDHVKTGLIDNRSDLAIVELMEYSTPPWCDQHEKKKRLLAENEQYVKDLPEVHPFHILEYAKARAESSNTHEKSAVRELFLESQRAFRAMKLPFYLAESFRQEGKYLAEIDEFDHADELYHRALSILEQSRSQPDQYSTTIYECWRLIAWNCYYSGGEGVDRARQIAEEKYVELKESGRRYMTSLYGILLSKVRASDPDFFQFGPLFFDTLEILEEAIRHLVAIPDSIDYPNALYQKLTLDIDYLDSASASDESVDGRVASLFERISETKFYYESLGSQQGVANVSYWEGKLQFHMGNFETSKVAFETALQTYHERSDNYGQFNALFRLGCVYINLNDFKSAVAALSDAWRICKEKGWEERYDQNLAVAIAKSPLLEENFAEVDYEARDS